MSLSSRNKRSKFKRKTDPIVQVSEGYMVGLDFISSTSELYDSTESLSRNPNIVIKGDTVILDYSELSSIGRTKNNSDIIEDDIQKLKVFFQATVIEGDTITISDAEYLNELIDSSVYDIGGSYRFKSFDVNNFIIILETISANNPSDTYDYYHSKYFINGTLKWTSSNSVTVTKTETVNEIVNRLGHDSKNSFRHVLGSPKNNDILEIRVGSTSYSFTVKEYYGDNNGEHIVVDEKVPDDVELFSNNIFLILKRRQTTPVTTNKRKVRTIARSAEKVHKMPNGKWMVGETHEEGVKIQKALDLVAKLNKELESTSTSTTSTTSSRTTSTTSITSESSSSDVLGSGY